MSPNPRMRRPGPPAGTPRACRGLAHADELEGLPVTSLMESAAPPRASPSSLVRMKPSRARRGRIGRGLHRVLANHGVGHEQDVLRRDRLLDVRELPHQRRRRWRAAGGVVDDHRRLSRAPPRSAWRQVRRRDAGLVEDRHAQPPPSTFSCSTAAGRYTSAATRSGFFPSLRSLLATLAAVVVLPEPWRPTIITPVGRPDRRTGARCPPGP